MGGRVFKEHFNGKESLKMDRETYFKIKEEITYFLFDWILEIKEADENSIISSNGYFIFPREFKDKESFGDIDVIVSNDWSDNKNDFFVTADNLIERIKKYFGPYSFIKINGPIVHFLYQNKYQIDFILTDRFDMRIKHFYLSYSIGMILGIIARHMGISFTMEGFRTKTDGILIKNDTFYSFDDYKVFEYFQLDKNQYKNIKTEEDAFKFVWSCPFAIHEVFKAA